MANTKISNLTGAASVTDASVFPVVDSGSTKKVTGTQIKTYARAGLSTVAVSGSYNDLSNKPTLFSGAYADLTGKPTLFDGNYNSLINQPTIPSLTGYATESFVNSAISQVNSGGASTGNIVFTDTNLNSINGDVTITFDQVASPAVGFSFTMSGDFNSPRVVTGGVVTQQVDMSYTRQVSSNTNVSCPPNVDTIIHTGTDQFQHTFKLLLKVEGNENPGQQGWDTQSCEMMIAKSFRNDTMAGSVYGLVYTSTNPLATFTTRWNSAINRVEVLCRPTSTTENVTVRSFVTEMTTSD